MMVENEKSRKLKQKNHMTWYGYVSLYDLRFHKNMSVKTEKSIWKNWWVTF